MLYATTRDSLVSFSPDQTLYPGVAADGGKFLPQSPPIETREDAHALLRLPFHDCVAVLLNRLFGTELVGADVALCLGKRAIQLRELGQGIFVLECWHDPAGRESAILANLSGLLPGRGDALSEWAEVAERAAILFAAAGQLLQQGLLKWGGTVDVASMAGSLRPAASAWYAKQWLAPIGRVLCACNENDSLWSLLRDGAFPMDALSVPTSTPEADITLPDGLERLAYACGREDEVARYLAAAQLGADYIPQEEPLAALRETLCAEVISRGRIANVQSTQRGLGRTFSHYDAACYAAIQDHRARLRSHRPCLMLSQIAP